MDKRMLSVVGAIGCLGLMVLMLMSTFLLSKFIHPAPAFIISVVVYATIFFFFFKALYDQGVDIRTAALYDDSERNFDDLEVNGAADLYVGEEDGNGPDGPAAGAQSPAPPAPEPEESKKQAADKAADRK